MFISLDLETTGLDKRTNRIIEFGATKFSLDPKEKVETLQSFIDPGVKIPEFITHITNITDKDVKKAPTIEEFAPQIQEFVGDLPIVGHFISFDVDFLKANNIRLKNPLYDTAEIARIFIPGLPSYSLEILSGIIGLKHEEKHRALDDSIAAQELFTKLTKQIQALPKELFKEVQKLSASSSWEFAKLIQTLSHEKSGETISIPKPSPSPKTLSPEEQKTFDLVTKEKSSSLIELFNPTTALIEKLAKETSETEKTVILVPPDIFRELPNDNKIGSPENYISLERLEIFKQKSEYNSPEITALIKTLIWLEQTENGLTTEGLNFSIDERQILPHIQANLENINLEKEPFVQKALELEKKSTTIISDYLYLPHPDTKNLIIIDAKNFITSLQYKHGEIISLKDACQPIKNLLTILKDPTLSEILTRVEILFGIVDSLLEKKQTPSPYPQPLELTNLEIASTNFSKIRDISISLISSSQALAEIVTPETLPYLKYWKKILKTLNSIFAEPDLDQFHIWIQKNYQGEAVIRKTPIHLAEYFKRIKDNSKRFTIIGKSIDAADNGRLIKTLLNISEETTLHKIKPPAEILEKSHIFITANIRGNSQENLSQTTAFIKNYILKEKGRNIIIMNSMMKLEQIQLILAPKLKKDGLTLLAQRGSGGLGKILELYKASPDTTSILLTPKVWELLDTSSLTEEEDFKNLVIHAIPFDPPSDQFMIASSKNFPDPWNELQIPNATLSLKKTVGKFLSKTPGQIIILDNRLIEKSYTKGFIKALEDFSNPEQTSIEQLLNS